MKKTLIILSVLALLLSSCAPKNYQWELSKVYWTDLNGKELEEILPRVPVRAWAKAKKKRGIGSGSSRGDIVSMTLVDMDDGRKFKGGLDTLRFDIKLGKDGKGYYDLVLEYEYCPPADSEIPEVKEIISDKYLIENQRVGAFIIGEPIPEQMENFTLEKELREMCWESECDTVPFFVVFENRDEMFSFEYSTIDSTNFINRISIASEKFKTAEGIGINSTIEDFAAAYPDYSIYFSYIDNVYVLQTKQLDSVHFELEEDGFIGDNSVSYDDGGVELNLSDFKKETKITVIIF